MTKTIVRRSERFYDFLLQFYPKSYRQEFGEEMRYVFSKSLRDAYRENGQHGIISLWARTIVDAGKSLYIQHLDNTKGGDVMKKNNDMVMQNKIFLWIAAATAALLTIPFMAMQFHLVKPDPSNPADMGVNWTLFDFIVMGILLFGMGSLFVFLARKVQKKHRLIVGLAVLAAFLLLWVHLAVGIVDTWPLAGS